MVVTMGAGSTTCGHTVVETLQFVPGTRPAPPPAPPAPTAGEATPGGSGSGPLARRRWASPYTHAFAAPPSGSSTAAIGMDGKTHVAGKGGGFSEVCWLVCVV